MIDWNYLKHLVDIVPKNLDKNKRKPYSRSDIKEKVRKRDKKCKVCGMKDKTDNELNNILHIHHIIPNGLSSEDNSVLLCKHCHQTVHCLLFSSGKWRFVNVLRAIRW